MSSLCAVSGVMRNLSWSDHLSFSCLMAYKTIPRGLVGRSQPDILVTARHGTDQWSCKLAALMDLIGDVSLQFYLGREKQPWVGEVCSCDR